MATEQAQGQRTALHRASVYAVQKWCRQHQMTLQKPPRHIYPRAYVIGHAAPGCLIVSQPWPDAEPQVREFVRANPLQTVHKFDESLKAGDWCLTAYVRTVGSGENIAIPLAESR